MKKNMHENFSNQAEAFLLGALDYSEEEQFLAHLASGCAECKKTIASMARVMHALPFALQSAIPSFDPPAASKQRLLHSIKTGESAALPGHEKTAVASPQVWKTWNAPKRARPESGFILQRANEGEGEETGINGIKVTRLFVDPAHDNLPCWCAGRPGLLIHATAMAQPNSATSSKAIFTSATRFCTPVITNAPIPTPFTAFNTPKMDACSLSFLRSMMNLWKNMTHKPSALRLPAWLSFLILSLDPQPIPPSPLFCCFLQTVYKFDSYIV
jgi:hypothetical protein